MTEIKKSVSEIRVQDPLSIVTRKERRNLLITSFVGIIMVQTGLIPTKINSFGIEFSETERQWFFIFTSLLIFYFLLVFIIYASSDFIAWRIAFNATKLHHLENEIKENHITSENLNPLRNRLWIWTRISRPVSIMRVIVEFIFPVLFGGYTIFKIYNR